MDKKINRNSRYGDMFYGTSPVESVEKLHEKSKSSKSFLENMFHEEFSDDSAPDNVVTAQFCDVCGHEIFEVEPYGPVSSLVEQIVASRDIVIKTSQQDSGELFVALIDETSAAANDLDVELSSLDLIGDVEMVDGGLLVKPDLWVGECDECENESIFENPTNPYDVEPAVSVLQNQLEALKFIASDEATEQFRAFVESDMDISQMNQAREERDQSLDKFGPGLSTDLTGEPEEFTMEFDNGSEITFDEVYGDAEPIDSFEVLQSITSEEMLKEIEDDFNPEKTEDEI